MTSKSRRVSNTGPTSSVDAVLSGCQEPLTNVDLDCCDNSAAIASRRLWAILRRLPMYLLCAFSLRLRRLARFLPIRSSIAIYLKQFPLLPHFAYTYFDREHRIVFQQSSKRMRHYVHHRFNSIADRTLRTRNNQRIMNFS